VKGALWLSPQEVERLVARFGTVGRALRALVDAHMHSEATGKRVAAYIEEDRRQEGVEVVTADSQPREWVQESGGPLVEVHPGTSVHRHRRGAVLRVDYDFGSPKTVWACTGCSEELT